MKTPNPGYKTLPLTALHEDPGNARWEMQKLEGDGRLDAMLESVVGRRLTYEELIA